MDDFRFDSMDAVLTEEVRSALDLPGYRRAQYDAALTEVEHLASESVLERRMRISSYLHLTRFLCHLLDRKDRMSMAVGLEVRVPFCDHRLVQYVYNAPWALKTYDGREKSLLRGAARDVLPQSVVERVKSPYPSTQDWRYVRDLQEQGEDLLADNDHDVFAVVGRGWLGAVTRRDPGTINVLDRQGLEWTLSLATWLSLYRPRLALEGSTPRADVNHRAPAGALGVR